MANKNECTYANLTDLYARKYGKTDEELQHIKSYLIECQTITNIIS